MKGRPLIDLILHQKKLIAYTIVQKVMASLRQQSTEDSEENGGRRGIRTPGTVTGSAVFKTAAFDHSAILPVE